MSEASSALSACLPKTCAGMVRAVLTTHTANRSPVASDANLHPALQADVEDDVAPAKRPTRKFKNLDKPWEDDSVDHWKQHSQGFTQYGHAGHGGRKSHVSPRWLRAGSRCRVTPGDLLVGAHAQPNRRLCPWRAGTNPSRRTT